MCAFQVVVGDSTAEHVYKAPGVTVVSYAVNPPPPRGLIGQRQKHNLYLDNTISAHLMVAAIEKSFAVCECLDGNNSVIPAIKVWGTFLTLGLLIETHRGDLRGGGQLHVVLWVSIYVLTLTLCWKSGGFT